MQLTITPEYLASQGLSPTFTQRFWSKVFIMPYDRGCWLWIGALRASGYGQIGTWKEGQPPISAHRASWILHRGPLPAGMCVCHKCDTPPCVNPDHLFLGTSRENTHDMIRKGRLVVGFRHKRSNHHNSKLNESKVDAIRILRSSGMSYQKIADLFSISQSLARQVGANLIWGR